MLKFAEVTNKTEMKCNKVYDLNVEDDNSYNIEKLIVHNSGVSSLVGYVLRIHRVDPLDPRWNGLPFERFLSSERNIKKVILEMEDGSKREFLETDEVTLKDGTKKLAINLSEDDEI